MARWQRALRETVIQMRISQTIAFVLLSLAGFCGLVASGCAPEVGDPPPIAEVEDTTQETPPSATPEISLQLAGMDAIAKLVEKNQGKVMLIDYWATWCGPCTEKFPHTVELDHKYRDSGLVVVSISVDDPEEKEQVLEFLPFGMYLSIGSTP